MDRLVSVLLETYQQYRVWALDGTHHAWVWLTATLLVMMYILIENLGEDNDDSNSDGDNDNRSGPPGGVY